MFVCNGYSTQSIICNCTMTGKCPLAKISTKIKPHIKTRCPRKPHAIKGGYYVTHNEEL